MQKNTSRRRYNIYSLITLIIIVLSFGYYYFFYIPMQEHIFHQKGFRIIESIGDNVKTQTENYEGIVINYLNQESAGIVFRKQVSKLLSLPELKKDGYKLPENISVSMDAMTKTQLPFTDKSILGHRPVDGNLEVFLSINQGNDSISYIYNIAKLFKQKMRYDFFNSYIVFDDDEVHYSDIPVAQTHSVFDSLKKEKAFISTAILNIDFDNETHKMYVVPVNISAGVTVFLGGIIDKGLFKRQTHSLNPYTVTFILVFLVIFLLSLPLLKLVLISENERFKTIDAFLGLIAIIIAAAFFTQILLYKYYDIGPENDRREKTLMLYADSIGKNFVNEIELGLEQLKACDDILKEYAEKPGNGRSRSSTPNLYPYDRVYDDSIFKKYGINEFMFTWLNNSGDQMVKWGIEKITPRMNAAQRNYFKEVNNERLWYLPDDYKTRENGFYLEYIQSKTEGSVYAVLSRNSDVGLLGKKNLKSGDNNPVRDSLTPVVIAMGMNFKSLDKLKTIGNLSYMLISEDGTVLSHKDKRKALQENIVAECNDNPELVKALFGKNDTYFRSFYNSRNNLFYIKSIESLPLYLLIALDDDYEKLNDIQVLVLSSELYGIILFVFLLEIGLFAFINRKRYVKTAGNKLYFEWIWPKPQNRRLYLFLTYYIIISYLVYYLTGLNNSLFHTISFLIIWLTTNLLLLKFAMIGKEEKKSGKSKQSVVILFMFSMCFLIVALLLFHWDHSPDFGPYLGFYVILALSVYMIILNKRGLFENEKEGRSKSMKKANIIDFRLAYSIYFMSLILALGFYPSIDFFNKSFKLEKELYMRNCQYSLLRNDASAMEFLKNKAALVNPGYSYQPLGDLPDGPDGNPLLTDKENKLIHLLRYSVDTIMNNSSILGLLNTDHDTNLYWIEKDDSLSLVSRSHDVIITSPKYDQLVAEANKGFRPLYFFSIVIGIFLVVIIFKLLQFWSRKVFLLDIDPLDHIDYRDAIERSKFVYIISPSLCETRDFLAEENYVQFSIDFLSQNTKEKLNVKIKELNDILKKTPKKELEGFNMLITDPFPHDDQNQGMKAEVIVELKHKFEELKGVRLIMLSTSHPAFYINTFKEKQESAYIDFKSYVNAIGDFVRCYYPIGFDLRKTEPGKDLYGIFDSYESKDNKDTEDAAKVPLVESEDTIIKVQVESQNYFYSIWNNLEAREQYLVYDIAQNGLINYKNLPIIYNLLNKGVLIRNDDYALVLFSKSFRNFVLSIIDREQALKAETMAKRSGNWSNIRLPLLMIFIAAFALLFIAEQEVFNDVIGWLLAASASIPILMRTFMSVSGSSLFGKSKDGG